MMGSISELLRLLRSYYEYKVCMSKFGLQKSAWSGQNLTLPNRLLRSCGNNTRTSAL